MIFDIIFNALSVIYWGSAGIAISAALIAGACVIASIYAQPRSNPLDYPLSDSLGFFFLASQIILFAAIFGVIHGLADAGLKILEQ
jgi:hypothetical protein